MVKDAERHLTAATEAHSYMKAQVETAKRDLRAMVTGPSPPTEAELEAPAAEK